MAITVGISEPVNDAQVRDYVDVQVRAFTQGGKQIAATRNRIDAHLAPNRSGNSLTEMVSELRLKPGVYEIRASAFSERMQTAGSVYTDIEIPDFTKAPLRFWRARHGVSQTGVADATPLSSPCPPAHDRREFSRIGVRAVRVYQGASDCARSHWTTILTKRARRSSTERNRWRRSIQHRPEDVRTTCRSPHCRRLYRPRRSVRRVAPGAARRAIPREIGGTCARLTPPLHFLRRVRVPAAQRPTFRATTNIVQTDDRARQDGRPVKGLTITI